MPVISLFPRGRRPLKLKPRSFEISAGPTALICKLHSLHAATHIILRYNSIPRL